MTLSPHPLPLPFADSLVNYSTQSTTLASLATACKWVSHANYISISCLPLLPLPLQPPLFPWGLLDAYLFYVLRLVFAAFLLLLAWLRLSKNYAQSRVDCSSVANEDAASFVDHLLQSLKVSTHPSPLFTLLLPAPDIVLPAFLSPPPHLSVYFACLAVYVALLVD